MLKLYLIVLGYYSLLTYRVSKNMKEIHLCFSKIVCTINILLRTKQTLSLCYVLKFFVLFLPIIQHVISHILIDSSESSPLFFRRLKLTILKCSRRKIYYFSMEIFFWKMIGGYFHICFYWIIDKNLIVFSYEKFKKLLSILMRIYFWPYIFSVSWFGREQLFLVMVKILHVINLILRPSKAHD